MAIIGQTLLQVVLAYGQGMQEADYSDGRPHFARKGRYSGTTVGVVTIAACTIRRIGRRRRSRGKLQFLCHGFVGSTRGNDQLPRDLRETVERLTAKAEGNTRAELFGGGVRLCQKGTRSRRNAEAVVRDFNDVQSLVEEADFAL